MCLLSDTAASAFPEAVFSIDKIPQDPSILQLQFPSQYCGAQLKMDQGHQINNCTVKLVVPCCSCYSSTIISSTIITSSGHKLQCPALWSSQCHCCCTVGVPRVWWRTPSGQLYHHGTNIMTTTSLVNETPFTLPYNARQTIEVAATSCSIGTR